MLTPHTSGTRHWHTQIYCTNVCVKPPGIEAAELHSIGAVVGLIGLQPLLLSISNLPALVSLGREVFLPVV